MGAADRGGRVAGRWRFLSGAFVSLFSWNIRASVRSQSLGDPHRAVASRFDFLRGDIFGRSKTFLARCRFGRRTDPRLLCAGDFLRRADRKERSRYFSTQLFAAAFAGKNRQ